MADINTLLKRILSAVYGKDVRQSIHDAIHKCYEDGKAGVIDLEAREKLDDLFPTVKPTAYSWENLDHIVTARVSSMVGAVANITVACDFDDITGDIFVTVHKGNNPETGLFVSAVHPTGFRLHRRGQLVGDPGVLQWDDWEWENPPMKPGVEYRTTERRSGYPVYTKSIFPQMPVAGSSSTTTITTGEGGDQIGVHYIFGSLLYQGGPESLEEIPFPIIGSEGSIAAYACSSIDNDQDQPSCDLIIRNISVNGDDQSFISCRFIVKYTK